MEKFILRNLVSGFIILMAAQVAHAADLKIAVNAPRGAVETHKWIPLAEQLGAAIGKTIEIVA